MSKTNTMSLMSQKGKEKRNNDKEKILKVS